MNVLQRESCVQQCLMMLGRMSNNEGNLLPLPVSLQLLYLLPEPFLNSASQPLYFILMCVCLICPSHPFDPSSSVRHLIRSVNLCALREFIHLPASL